MMLLFTLVPRSHGQYSPLCLYSAQVQLPSAPLPVNTTYFTHRDQYGNITLGQDSLPLSTYPLNATGNAPNQVRIPRSHAGIRIMIQRAEHACAGVRHTGHVTI